MPFDNPAANHPDAPVVKRSTRWIRLALALIGAVLLGDAVALMGMGLFNFGITLPGGIGIAFLLLALCWNGVARWRKADRRRQWLWRAGWLAFAVWLVTVGVFFHGIRSGMGVAVPAGTAVKAIVILGSGTPNCEASPTLIARLDQGLVQARRWPEARVVVSGGQDFGLRCVEADIMAGYLITRGVAADRMIREGRSTSTEENLVFSRRLLEGQGVDATAPIVVVTSDFHVRRAVQIAGKAGFGNVAGVGAGTPIYLRYNAWLREYFATISGWVLKEY
ncbi:YdcF family protein [Cupriavidus taiwanensis]|uniref:YdcF family protein n=1 Tax=Cupriavidus taiwanensis TaxID=164546 RepID=UPI001573AD4A|nr:YdcF family protein [Cupriavidus taiwanensis]NSX17879.1 YdcF family protein [Cupriavidus taiwanensis]